MAVTFRSSTRRAYWTWFVMSWVIDAALVFVAASFLGQERNAVWWALLLPIAVYLVEVILGLYRFAKRMLIFAFEKEGRILETMAALQNDGYPPPRTHYEDVDEYLQQAVLGSANPKVQLAAAVTLGSLASQRAFGPRAEAICTSIVIENAIRRLPPQDV